MAIQIQSSADTRPPTISRVPRELPELLRAEAASPTMPPYATILPSECQLVGAFNPSEKYEFVNWDDYSIPFPIIIWENHPAMFQENHQAVSLGPQLIWMFSAAGP